MKYKIIFIGLLGITSFFASCKKDETTTVASTTTDASLSESGLDKLTELGLLTSNAEAKKDSTGKPKGPCKLTEVDIAALPTVITSYISTNYPGSTIEKAGTDQDGKYFIALAKADKTGAGLLFDAAGVFLAEKALPPHPDKGSPADIATLPAAIGSYISTTYPGAAIEKACVRADGNYVVLITKADGSHTALAFDAAGTFLIELPAPPAPPKDHKGPKGPKPDKPKK